jgi:hypothetical protein
LVRMAEGRGISPMASKEEKEAWVAAEAMAGRRSPMELPESYGGMGERPEATTRRGLRMQQEWDKQREMMIQEQEAIRQAERESKQLQIQEEQLRLQQRDQLIQEETYRSELNKKEAAQELEGQLQVQSNQIFNWLNGKLVDVNGKPIPKPDIKSRDFQAQLYDIAARNPLGAEANRQLLDQYIGINKTYIGAEDELTGKELQDITKTAELAGKKLSDFIRNDPATGKEVIDYEALGRAEAEVERKVPKERERVIGGKKLSEIESTITSIEADIVAAKASDNAGLVDGLTKKKEYYQGLLSSGDKGVDTTAKSQYSVPKDRVVGEVYDTPKGKLKWTGTGWTKP